MTSVTFKTGQIKKTYDISCILISFTCDENLVKIRPFLRELSHFLCSGVSCYVHVRVVIYLVTRGSPVQISVESSTFFLFLFSFTLFTCNLFFKFDADPVFGVTTRGRKPLKCIPAQTVGRIIAKFWLQVHLITIHEINPGFLI